MTSPFRPFATIAAAYVASMTLISCVPEGPATTLPTRAERGAAIFAECVATQCETLNLDRATLEDYSTLGGLDHVTALMISYSDFDDLSEIAEMDQLIELHIGWTDVSDLSLLRAFPNLRLLHAQQLAEGADLSAIGQLSGLEELGVGNRSTTDIGFVSGLHSLRALDISGTDVSDLSPLEGLRKLERLDLGWIPVTDLGPLMRLPNLKQVSVTLYDRDEAFLAQVQALRDRGVEVTEIEAIVMC